ncbi:MAG: LytTR family DNA-binding domain-containing protein [Clostridia bacterium]|nr:LytTR family DNA-binding domain-containing protein [Clostridia bacterium]
MKIAICDDEPVVAGELRALTESYFDSVGIPVQIDEYYSGEDLLASDEAYGILMLDCLLPGIDGVGLGKQMRQKDPYSEIIFITAYTDYLFDSYDVRHLKYILKPFDAQMINKTFDDFLSTRNDRKPIMIMTDLSVPMSEINYLTFSNKAVSVYTDNTVYNSRKTLNQFERELNPNTFFRANRGVIFNFGYIERHKDGNVILENGSEIRLSRRLRKPFLKAYTRFLNSYN